MTGCKFIDNTAQYGGGMGNGDGFEVNAAIPLVVDSLFVGNKTRFGGDGGGMYNEHGSDTTVINCIFSGNHSQRDGVGDANGAAVWNDFADPTLTSSLLVGNFAEGHAGAISIDMDSTATLINCTFAANKADLDGGGIALTAADSAAIVDNCIFWGNSDSGPQDESAQIHFVGITGPTATYTDIMGLDLTVSGPFCADPSADPPCEGNINDNPRFLEDPVMPSGTWSAAPAVYCSPSCPEDPRCNDCDDALIEVGQTLFTDAEGEWIDDALVGKFLNPDTAQFLQSLIVSNTDKKIVVWGDFKDLWTDMTPYQINDYHLDSPDSPCIDAADNNAVTICSADLDGNERFFDDPATPPTGNPPGEEVLVDMGAYEFGGDPELDCDLNYIADSCCPADFDGDGRVDAFDLAQLLGSWGDCPEVCIVDVSTCECRADFDNSCDVKAFDLAQLLGDWGPCCGDAQCLLDEDCTTCEEDCGACP